MRTFCCHRFPMNFPIMEMGTCTKHSLAA
jgi:hypothetical protein